VEFGINENTGCSPELPKVHLPVLFSIYSLIETAKANGLEPYWYLRHLIEKLPDAMTEDDYKALLPQYLDPSQLAGPPNIP